MKFSDNILQQIIRRLSRDKMSSLIKMISLCIGMTCFILVSLYVYHEISYDQFNKRADNIVRITSEYSVDGNIERSANTGSKAGPQLQRVYPEVRAFTRIRRNAEVIAHNEVMFSEKNFLYVDSAFLMIFTFPLVEGNMSSALASPGKINNAFNGS